MKKSIIRLTLAPDHEHPEGDPACGYEFEAPLNSLGEIDLTEWRKAPRDYKVTRFWSGETDQHGHLVFDSNKSWHFHYGLYNELDEPTYQFGQQLFKKGQYVSLRDHADQMHMFQVDSVKQLESV